MLQSIISEANLRKDRCVWRIIPSKTAQYSQIKNPSNVFVNQYLDQLGINALYTHQAEAYEILREGKNILVSTPTASGKSLIYQLPSLELILRDPRATVLYLFPFKALAQDQAKSLST
ncbi:DEAD/DEAH box helicase, partial [bacterium]|nr:DEAD/DEAH box helicase [candidate division CSSED10-310 bacterium]